MIYHLSSIATTNFSNIGDQKLSIIQISLEWQGFNVSNLKKSTTFNLKANHLQDFWKISTFEQKTVLLLDQQVH